MKKRDTKHHAKPNQAPGVWSPPEKKQVARRHDPVKDASQPLQPISAKQPERRGLASSMGSKTPAFAKKKEDT